MVFSSYEFLFVFLPAVLALYFVPALFLRGDAHAQRLHLLRGLVLLTSSYFFYGWARYWYLVLIAGSTLIDLVCGRMLARLTERTARRAVLCVSLTGNLGLLGWFKYRDFGISIADDLLGALGGSGWHPELARLVLPVGISFYTFQSMSYTIDVYRGHVQPLPWRRSLEFFTYVSLFPQLVAGPIVRFRDVAAALRSRRHTLAAFASGAQLFMFGMAKKVLVANRVGPLADGLFQLDHPGVGDCWLGMLAYALQIYFDFSGYSDMAIGLGRMFGFDFPTNFESPYKAESITDFWRRWHISLSTWLRDYLYISLGGNRRGPWKTYRNLMLTMLLGGLWHGAAWTFVLWGAWHGFWLSLERSRGKHGLLSGLPRPVRMLSTFLIVLFGWVLFRAPDMAAVGRVFAGLTGFGGAAALQVFGPFSPELPSIVLAAGTAIAFLTPTARALADRASWPVALLAMALFWVSALELLQSSFNPFLYYQF